MPLDFFRPGCTTPNAYCVITRVKPCLSTIIQTKFGLMDDPDNDDEPAFVQYYNPADWIATVEIDRSLVNHMIFHAVDKCLIFPPPPPNIKNRICDCLLKYENNIIFIELKDKNASWNFKEACEQLEHTIQVFNDNDDLTHFENRKAIICNKAKPHFTDIAMTIVDKFERNNFGFELIMNTILTLS